MRGLVLLGVHGAASTVFMFGAAFVGPVLAGAQSSQVAGAYILLQLLAALLIAASAGPGWKLPMAVGAVAAAGWGLWCAFVATMALSGNWL